jgi:hypothetical protein
VEVSFEIENLSLDKVEVGVAIDLNECVVLCKHEFFFGNFMFRVSKYEFIAQIHKMFDVFHGTKLSVVYLF